MIWFSLLLTFIVSWSICRVVVHHAVAWRLVDVPNDRSSHATPTPRGGGVGIVFGFLGGCTALLVSGAENLDLALLSAGLALAVLGFFDDRLSLSVVPRFFVQTLCALAAVALTDLVALRGLPLHMLLIGAAVVYLVWLTNLYNFMDGIDGIAVVEALTVLASVACISVLSTGSVESQVWVVLAAACAGFLPWNWSPARLFMGDVGSTFLGFMLGAWSLSSTSVPMVCWLILLAAFIGDASVTLLLRLARGEQVFQAHRTHLYQRLAVRWASHRKVCLLVSLVNLFWLLPLAYMANRCVGNSIFAALLLAVAYLPIVLVVYNMSKVEGCCVGKNSIESAFRE